MGRLEKSEKHESHFPMIRDMAQASIRALKRWELVELINWCQGQDDEDESFHLKVQERGPDKIAIDAFTLNPRSVLESEDERRESTLVVDWQSGATDVERGRMKPRDGLKFWREILSQALEGKIEKAIHRGYFRCKVCNDTVWLSGPVDIWSHLSEHKIPVEQVIVGDGIALKMGEKTVELDDFLVGEDTPIH